MATNLDIIRQRREAIRKTSITDMQDNNMTHSKDSIYEMKTSFLSSEVRFYGVNDLMEMLGWSKRTVLKVFSDPKFPSSDFGKTKVVEAHALIEYFSVKRTRDTDRHWSGQEVV